VHGQVRCALDGQHSLSHSLTDSPWLLPAAHAVPTFVSGSWLAVATVSGSEGPAVVGCARVEPTPIPFPDGRITAGTDADELLAGGLEVVEMVVDAMARGYGVGSMLLGVLPALARGGRAWMMLGGAERSALRSSSGTGGRRSGSTTTRLC
jgi:GNAT superfamily N-acetyltransferase